MKPKSGMLAETELAAASQPVDVARFESETHQFSTRTDAAERNCTQEIAGQEAH